MTGSVSQIVTSDSDSRDRAALLLAFGATQGEAGDGAEVSRRTVIRWTKEPEFARQVCDIRRAALESALGKIAAGVFEAGEKLVALATQPHSNGSVRLGAIKLMLERLQESVLIADLEARLDAVEKRLT